ncbi:MAG: hypothetical protein LH650_00075, partial [Chloroflexi bacterium]|nr:hypothetical protein [Chloroflexota bacterium]
MIRRSRFALPTAALLGVTLVISACASTAPTPKPAPPLPTVAASAAATVNTTVAPTTAVASQP